MTTADDLSRFDRDPDALAWARAKVQRRIDKCQRFAERAAARGDDDGQAEFWRQMADYMQREFIGGTGCVITAFDARRPQLEAALNQAQPPVAAASNPDSCGQIARRGQHPRTPGEDVTP